MTELQLGLLIIGAVVVAGVLAYNRVQEGRARRAAEKAFGAAGGDALLDEPARPVATPAALPDPPAHAAALPDPRIDYIVQVDFQPPLACSRLRERWRTHEHRYARRANLACSAVGEAWTPLDAGGAGEAVRLRAGLQLVTRDGPVGEGDLIEFRAAVETLAAETGGRVDAPEMRLAVERARELDAFCADADIQVVLQVVPAPNATLETDQARKAIAGWDLAADGPGGLARRDAQGRVEFRLDIHEGTAPGVAASVVSGATITLDVARVGAPCAVFRAMTACARELAQALGGALVDDSGRVLDDRALAAIETQLQAVQATFAERGIEPGSALASRLFA